MSEAGSEPAFELRYELSEVHFTRLVQLCQKSMWGPWKPYLHAFAGYFVVALVAALIASAYGLTVRRMASVMVLGAVVFYFTGRFISIALRPQMVADHGCWVGEVVARATLGQIDFVHSRYQCTYSWAGILKIIDGSDAVVLMTDLAGGVIIPKTAFSSESELEAFLHFVGERIDAAKLTAALA